MRFASLFSGIDVFALVAEEFGWEVIFQCENDPYCQQVLDRHYPQSQKYGDIRRFDANCWHGAIDILAGGDPCQPSSSAGKKKGQNDHRYLWPEMHRIIREVRPRWIVNENVAGTISNGILDRKIDDLENEGYTCWTPILVPANTVGAWHIRKRVFLIAYADAQRWPRVLCRKSERIPDQEVENNALDIHCHPFLQFEQRVGKPAVLGVDDGTPNRVQRLGAVGNAIHADVVRAIFSSIINYIYETQAK